MIGEEKCLMEYDVETLVKTLGYACMSIEKMRFVYNNPCYL
jgi:hypothetical protein